MVLVRKKNMQRVFFLILTTFLVGFSGCKKPMKHPETIDPIYKDYQKELDVTKREFESTEKFMQLKKKDLDSAPPRSSLKRGLQDEYFTVRAEYERLLQKMRYLEQKLVSRKNQATESYHQAF